MPTPKEEIAENVLTRYKEADMRKSEMTAVWEALGKYARPSRANAGVLTTGTQTGNQTVDGFTRLHDSSLMNANIRHCGGVKAWVAPASTPFFELEPSDGFEDDEEVKIWCAGVTLKMHKLLSRSNFHTEDHEAILDGGAFGTRGVFVEDAWSNGREGPSPFNFQCWETGTFSILENARGVIDTTFRVIEYTLRQAVQKFGEQALPVALQERYKVKPGDSTKEKFILAIYPREDAERDKFKIDAANMAFASVWLHEASKTIVRTSGFEEMPGAFSRYLKWGGTPYGIPPSLLALADARQLNSLERDLDLLAAIAANPRMLLPAEMEGGKADMRPGGPTFYRDPNRIPKTWGTEARYDIGQERSAMRRENIRDAFMLQAFEAFRGITKQMTSSEVSAIREEQFDLFSPMFTLMSTEHYQPTIQRAFNIALRHGLLGEVPSKMMIEDGSGMAFVPPPNVVFVGRIALALKQIHMSAFGESLNRRTSVAAVIGPSAFDDINIPKAMGDMDRMMGLPVTWRRSGDEIAAIQKQRQEQEALAANAAAAKDVATAAGKAKGTPLEGLMA
jgi:hypothetical protein